MDIFRKRCCISQNKLDRKYDYLINILGADHAGYIKRITSSVDALSNSKNKLICKVSQLVKLIKDNKPFKMSKRKGNYITVDDLISEVGKDATRFIMLNRSSDVELDLILITLKRNQKKIHFTMFNIVTLEFLQCIAI
jgi:arginyl-tRNA synthetase